MPIVRKPARPERNLYIDECRGIAALSVIAIHTAFYGFPDVAEWFKSLTLFIDVPFFFYLSGWASSYSNPDVIKALKSILRIWSKWIVFILAINIFCFISLKLPFPYAPLRSPVDLFKALVFDEQTSPGFFVVGMSVWFIPFYFMVLLLNNSALTLIRRSVRSKEYSIAYLVFQLLIVLWAYIHPDVFGYYPPFIMFYGAIWMIGYIRAEKRDSLKSLLCALAICLAGLFVFSYLDAYLRGIPWYNVQLAKIIPSGKYLFVSSFAILIAGNLERFSYKPNKWLVHIGKNAIYYFFGQGVGSSILAYGQISLNIRPWFLKWLVYFLINIVITVIVAESTRYIYTGISTLVTGIYKKIRRIE